MEWIIPAIIGWCGTYVPRRFPGGGGGLPNPEDWPPVNCPVCGRVVGSIGAVIINVLVGPSLAEAGFFASALVSFAAGSATANLVAGISGMIRGK